jgi:hypothetical protein
MRRAAGLAAKGGPVSKRFRGMRRKPLTPIVNDYRRGKRDEAR